MHLFFQDTVHRLDEDEYVADFKGIDIFANKFLELLEVKFSFMKRRIQQSV